MGILDILKKTAETEIKIIKKLDVRECPWCNEALLIRVINGQGKLCRAVGEYDKKDEYRSSQLLLNGKPVIQARYPRCPTCQGLLAAGCGIENVDAAELKEISHRINDGYGGIERACENISPILKLLCSGAYVIADIPHYPSDGMGKFFWHASSEPEYNDAACSIYIPVYASGFVNSFPAFLYPSQGTAAFNRERAEHYVNEFKNGRFPRAIAYNEFGFMSLLLDGHHKAYAAAKLGQKVNCTAILPLEYVSLKKGSDGNQYADEFLFGGLAVSADRKVTYDEILPYMENISPKANPEMQRFPPIVGNFDKEVIRRHYTDIDELAVLGLSGNEEMTDEKVSEWFENIARDGGDDYEITKTVYALHFFSETAPEKARSFAIKILRKSYHSKLPFKLVYSAFETLLLHRDEEVEQLFIDHLVNEPDSEFQDIVNAYWE